MYSRYGVLDVEGGATRTPSSPLFISVHVYGSKSAQKSYKRTGSFTMAVNRPGWVPGISPGKPLPEKATETFPIRASDSCRKLLTAEIVRQTNAWSTARVLEGSDRFYPFHSPKSGKCKRSVKRVKSVKVYSVREELFILYNLC